MDTDLKHEEISIKWKIFVYILGFGAILLAVLWFVQTVYLNSFYRYIKKNELGNAREKVKAMINNNNIKDIVDDISQEYDICIIIADKNGRKVYSCESVRNCTIHRLRSSGLREIYNKTSEAADYVEIKLDEKEGDETTQDGSENNLRDENTRQIKKNGSVIQACMVKNNLDQNLVVILDSVITPLDATKYTLRIQLIYISGLVFVLSLLIAFIISKRISGSIIKINASAKELSNGIYDIEFDGKDYKEIAELSDTLNNTAKKLSRSDMLQKELIANVSHDLRTPLTMIAGYAEVMRDIPGENTPENVQVIIDETNRLTRLVNDMLDISKIQAGVTELETKEYDITESICNTIARYDRLVEPYGYNITFTGEQHVIVDADEFKIYQVVYNLISNAINYTGSDKKIYVVQKFDGKKVRIEVTDTGEGISSEEIENVWERYYKIDKNHKRAVIGTGLGLSIVKNILELHNAKYGVDSKVSEGSTFWFELEGHLVGKE